MTLTKKEIKKILRHHIKRKLKILGGHGQISVRRLGKSIFTKNGKGTSYEEAPNCKQRQLIYQVAVDLCEEYGGKVESKTYRTRASYDNCARVYQF